MRIRKRLLASALGAMLLLQGGAAWAHHSVVAQFDLQNPVTLKGTVTKVEWVNPHGFIHLNVKGRDGKVAEWKIETGSPVRMEGRGLKKEDFRVGVEAIIGGFGARDGSKSIAGWIVTFPDREGSFPEREATFPLGR